MSSRKELTDKLIGGILREANVNFMMAADLGKEPDRFTVTKFAHGRHDFQVRFEDGAVFRVAVEEWDEERQQPKLPRVGPFGLPGD